MLDNHILSVYIDKETADKVRVAAGIKELTVSQYLKCIIDHALNPVSEHKRERTISFEESLLKENAGLRLHLYKYKRKYRALNRILRGKLRDKINGCHLQMLNFTRRCNEADPQETEKLRSIIKFIQMEKRDLQAIYDMCEEAIID